MLFSLADENKPPTAKNLHGISICRLKKKDAKGNC
jgi:hypothetical protein